MADTLRVAVLSPVWFAVPPTGYGGIELVVSLLADGLAEAGHDVTLFASGDSLTKGKLSSVYPDGAERAHRARDAGSAARARLLRPGGRVRRDQRPHRHARRRLGGLVDTPVLHTVHGPLDAPSRRRCTAGSRGWHPKWG